MKKYQSLLILCLLTFLFLPSLAQSQSKADKIEDLISQYHKTDRFNGSALVAHEGSVIYKGGHGLANMEWDIKNESDTKHRLGSITKQFTAMLVLQLMEEGRLDLNTPIVKYVPDYKSETANVITLHHLMTHTSGIPNYTSFPGFFRDDSRDPYSPKDFLEFFVDSTLNFTPGSQYSYSNSAYFLLGYIVETVTGNTYEEELHSRIFGPLGMENTGFDHHADILAKRATGYEKDGMGYVNSSYLDMSIPYAAGSMYSTVEDLYIWDQALYTEKLLSKKNMDLMFTDHMSNYGYGWGVREVDGDTEIGHGGGINGFNTIISRRIKKKNLVVLLNNTGGTDLNSMKQGIMAILNDKPYDKPGMSLARETYEIIKSDGIDKGLAHFDIMKEKDSYDVDENEINAMGYDLLRNDKIEDAIKVFRLNMKLFPDSWNVYDSYAEANLTAGKNEEAIKYYKKSVEMNPANVSGIKFLKQLGVDVSSFTKEVVVADEILSSYIGKYQLQPGFFIEISKEGSQLKAKATGQGTIEIYPKSDTEFYAKAIQASVIFNKNDAGEIESFTLHQGGQAMPAKKIE